MPIALCCLGCLVTFLLIKVDRGFQETGNLALSGDSKIIELHVM